MNFAGASPDHAHAFPIAGGRFCRWRDSTASLPSFGEQTPLLHILRWLHCQQELLHMKGPRNWGRSGLRFQAHCSFHRSQLEQAVCNAPGIPGSWALSPDDSPRPSVWDRYLGLFIREAEIIPQAGKGACTPTTYASNFRLRYGVRQNGSFTRQSTVHVQFRRPGSSDGEVSFSHCQCKKKKLLILALKDSLLTNSL